MFARYRQVLSLPGTLRFSAAALVGRLPNSMDTIGIVLLVTAAGGSYGVAGAMSAAYLLAAATIAIPQARLVDRLGQGRVLSVAAGVFAAAMTAFVVVVREHGSPWVAVACVVVAGAAFPQVGSSVRSRWSHVLDDRALVDTAYALESAVDEVVFITGPILVTVLATAWSPVAGLGATIIAGTGGTLFFAAQRSTAPPPAPRIPGERPPRLRLSVMGPVCLVGVALGTLFGAAEVSTVAFAADRGLKGYAGPLLAVWAAGSLIAGIVTGLVTWRVGPVVRLRWGAAGMFVAMAPLSLIGSMWVMEAWLFVAGFAIAPTMIAALSLVEKSVPRSRLTEGMAIVETSFVVGLAPGAAVAGRVIDTHGPSAAYLVSLAAGFVAAVATFASRDEPAGVPALSRPEP
ncbi:MAG TPA: MFS transporter [Nocardioides sp.]|uniref:MFS transporter n=1 Tax=Nocardioides sp. TaxID=35761 RepID=UPI002F42AF82